MTKTVGTNDVKDDEPTSKSGQRPPIQESSVSSILNNKRGNDKKIKEERSNKKSKRIGKGILFVGKKSSAGNSLFVVRKKEKDNLKDSSISSSIDKEVNDQTVKVDESKSVVLYQSDSNLFPSQIKIANEKTNLNCEEVVGDDAYEMVILFLGPNGKIRGVRRLPFNLEHLKRRATVEKSTFVDEGTQCESLQSESDCNFKERWKNLKATTLGPVRENEFHGITGIDSVAELQESQTVFKEDLSPREVFARRFQSQYQVNNNLFTQADEGQEFYDCSEERVLRNAPESFQRYPMSQELHSKSERDRFYFSKSVRETEKADEFNSRMNRHVFEEEGLPRSHSPERIVQSTREPFDQLPDCRKFHRNEPSVFWKNERLPKDLSKIYETFRKSYIPVNKVRSNRSEKMEENYKPIPEIKPANLGTFKSFCPRPEETFRFGTRDCCYYAGNIGNKLPDNLEQNSTFRRPVDEVREAQNYCRNRPTCQYNYRRNPCIPNRQTSPENRYCYYNLETGQSFSDIDTNSSKISSSSYQSFSERNAIFSSRFRRDYIPVRQGNTKKTDEMKTPEAGPNEWRDENEKSPTKDIVVNILVNQSKLGTQNKPEGKAVLPNFTVDSTLPDRAKAAKPTKQLSKISVSISEETEDEIDEDINKDLVKPLEENRHNVKFSNTFGESNLTFEFQDSRERSENSGLSCLQVPQSKRVLFPRIFSDFSIENKNNPITSKFMLSNNQK